MPYRPLHVVVRTPREVVAELEVLALRVPTESGQVGIRPAAEAVVTAVEPGLVLARVAGGMRFIGTAGGLLRASAREAVLLTPLAVLGERAEDVVAAVDRALSGAGAEHDLRQAIERLEAGLLREVRRGAGDHRE